MKHYFFRFFLFSRIQTTKLLPYQRAYQYRTYEFCFDPKENFRCPRNKYLKQNKNVLILFQRFTTIIFRIGYKISYKNVTKIEIISKEICCPGFIRENVHCIRKRF